MALEKYNFCLTYDHMISGEPNNPRGCPIAQCIKNHEDFADKIIKVRKNTIEINYVSFELPDKCISFIEEFDNFEFDEDDYKSSIIANFNEFDFSLQVELENVT